MNFIVYMIAMLGAVLGMAGRSAAAETAPAATIADAAPSDDMGGTGPERSADAGDHGHHDHHGHNPHGHDHGSGHDHGQDAGAPHCHVPQSPLPPYVDITTFGMHEGVSMHIHVHALVGGRTPITTEAHAIYNGLRGFLGLDPVALETIGAWAFANDLTNNTTAWDQDLEGVGLYYAMQGSKAGWIDDAAYDPQILADIQRTARLGDPEDVMAMVRTHGHAGLADYLAHAGLEEAFVNTLKMEPHFGGWKHGRAHGRLEFDNEAGYNAPANSATAHDVNHLTVVNHDQTQSFYNDTFDWPQWSGRMVPDDVVINYFQSMITLGAPKGEGITAQDVAEADAARADADCVLSAIATQGVWDDTMPADPVEDEAPGGM